LTKFVDNFFVAYLNLLLIAINKISRTVPQENHCVAEGLKHWFNYCIGSIRYNYCYQYIINPPLYNL